MICSSASGFYFWAPCVDVYETDDSLILYAEMPGVSPRDIEILIEQRSVLMRGVKNRPVSGLSADSVEIETGRFERFVPLPVVIEPDTTTAELSDGLLKIVLPKRGGGRVVLPVRASSGSDSELRIARPGTTGEDEETGDVDDR